MKSLKSILFSTRLTAMLFISFAVSMAVGTFLENDYGTPTARIWVYNAWWFELMMALFLVNFIGNISRYRLLRKEKLAILTIHLSFILIIFGAFITRYIGYEGMMPIREGATQDSFLSEKAYLTTLIDGDYKGQPLRKTVEKHLLLSEYTDNDFVIKEDFKGKKINILYKKYYEHAKETLLEEPTGESYLKMVAAEKGNRKEYFLKSGQVRNINNILISLNNPVKGAINIDTSNDIYTISSPFSGQYTRMADRKEGFLNQGKIDTLQLRSLYSIATLQLVFPEKLIKGKIGIEKTVPKDPLSKEGLLLELSSGAENQEVYILGGKGHSPDYKTFKINGLDINMSFSSKLYKLPFSISLKDFIAEKYPGTQQGYASFMSKVKVNGKETFDYDIYMNHILDYGGYRFFQSSFDTDEKGTILSVNHDFWGTWVTYIGYFLLYLGLLAFMFFGETRFIKLGKMLKKLKAQRTSMVILVILFSSVKAWSQVPLLEMSPQRVDSLREAQVIGKKQAEDFGKLIIQDGDGRMKPINTFSSELLRKISKSDHYKDLNADQVLLSMIENPMIWYHTEFIYLRRGNDSIRKLIGVSSEKKYAKLVDFFDKEGRYKLAPYLREAYAKSTPNQFEKDFRETDLKLALLNRTLGGDLLRIFPVPEDSNHTWTSASEVETGKYQIKDSLYLNFIKNAVPFYLSSLHQVEQNGNYVQANKILGAIKKNQKNYSADIIPSANKVRAEILYNRYDIFKKLFSYYLYVGSLLMVVLIVMIFKETKALQIITTTLKYLIYLLFILHSLGLITRWYISGHAPWSNAYESMIYIAWATMGMGMLFARKSIMTLAATAFVTAMVLMVAHWNWLDPNVENLQPVLNSYWLMVHVAVIVASYGPFTLGMILGIISLFLILFTNNSNRDKTILVIKELTIVNELSLTVGLVMLITGNFLGGQWANESWGRYWGWDPKETWALISIMVYAFVIHMRLVPKLRGVFAFNLASIIAYSSILMTYFGVNFYLSGLHSYASGDKVVTPSFVYYSMIFVFLLGTLSYIRYRKYQQK